MKTSELIKGEKYQITWIGKKYTGIYLYSERIADGTSGRYYLFHLSDTDGDKGIIRLDKRDINRIVLELPGTPKKPPKQKQDSSNEPLELLCPIHPTRAKFRLIRSQ